MLGYLPPPHRWPQTEAPAAPPLGLVEVANASWGDPGIATQPVRPYPKPHQDLMLLSPRAPPQLRYAPGTVVTTKQAVEPDPSTMTTGPGQPSPTMKHDKPLTAIQC